MSLQDPAWQYITGQMHPHFPALLQRFAEDSAAVSPCVANAPYGPHPRQKFDFMTSPSAWRGTLAFFHAGYWQSRDKSQFRMIAPGLLKYGIDVAMVNYPLCPEVTLPALIDASRAVVPRVLAHAAAIGRGGKSLSLAGHSAGGHIAAELALLNWAGPSPIAAVIGLSGIYDLAPLVNTPLNDNLRLDAATARAMSPVHRLRKGLPQALFAVGGRETQAFNMQTREMDAAWRLAGNISEHLVVASADHFSLLSALEQTTPLLQRIANLVIAASSRPFSDAPA